MNELPHNFPFNFGERSDEQKLRELLQESLWNQRQLMGVVEKQQKVIDAQQRSLESVYKRLTQLEQQVEQLLQNQAEG